MLDRRQPITITAAQAKIAALTLEPKVEAVATTAADRRVLAEPVTAPYDFPNFRRSGYDGYAIRAEDDHDFPKTFKVVAEIQAGATYDQPLKANETVRIMTGAAVPTNAGKVIMLEQSRPVAEHKDQVKLMVTAKNTNITETGTEFQRGDVLIPQNTRLNPGHLSLLSAFGITEVSVYQTPKVGIITTGTEVTTPGDPLKPGRIYNSNGPLLQGLVTECGGEVVAYTQIEDDYDLLRQKLNALVTTCDLILTTGGVSVGDFDFLATVAKSSQNLLFNKLKMRPGSVTTAFVYQETPIVALSGNPGACFTGFYLFAEPLLQQFTKQASQVRHVTAILDKPYQKTNGYDRILRGTFRISHDHYYVQLVGSDKSGALGNLGQTTCLFKIPSSNRPIEPFSEVETWLLPYR
ncbi:molybdopterin molybdotransferase MoeA [Agrilactobacillus fermenti]|uniref:molybdopterin molybdotransferase MoeA n=1 Tax=Agrilactobacillus fermenti TaxID=2586909 RepID=UPI003A5C2C9C